MGLTKDHVKQWIQKANAEIQEQKSYLTDLDQAIGDGDHGINIARGFNEAEKKIDATAYETPADLLKDCAMTLLSKVGGASGPLYGTAFLKISQTLKDKTEIDYHALTAAMEKGLNGLVQRGKAEENQKTMLDVWYPVVRWLKSHDAFDSQSFIDTAKEAMGKTKDLKAEKGRAAYLNERSIGHIDPGSASSYYVLKALAEVVEQEGVEL